MGLQTWRWCSLRLRFQLTGRCVNLLCSATERLIWIHGARNSRTHSQRRAASVDECHLAAVVRDVRRHAVHESEQALRDADLVVALGCRFSEFTTKRWTLLPPEADLVHVDIDPVELGRTYPPRVGLVSDAAAASRELARALTPLIAADPARAARRTARREALRKEYDDAAALPPLPTPTDTVSSAALAQAVQRLADRDGLVLVQDVHTFGPWILPRELRPGTQPLRLCGRGNGMGPARGDGDGTGPAGRTRRRAERRRQQVEHVLHARQQLLGARGLTPNTPSRPRDQAWPRTAGGSGRLGQSLWASIRRACPPD